VPFIFVLIVCFAVPSLLFLFTFAAPKRRRKKISVIYHRAIYICANLFRRAFATFCFHLRRAFHFFAAPYFFCQDFYFYEPPL
jgi:hypothetical protein